MAVKAEQIIADLFAAYVQETEILPYEIQENIEKRGLERAVCDYVAGMTDRFAIEEHGKLFDPQMRP
jgi:dGTPase